jgi:hypothetical protein
MLESSSVAVFLLVPRRTGAHRGKKSNVKVYKRAAQPVARPAAESEALHPAKNVEIR